MLISTSSQKLLKVLHLLAASAWIGGCIAVITLVWASSKAQDANELYGILNGVRYVNVIVVVYLGAFSTFFTGLAYALCTNRGFFRYTWITLKWVLTAIAMLGGAFLLGPRSTAMLEAADLMGLAALNTPGYLEIHTFVLMLLGLEGLLLVIAVVLSVYRPGEYHSATSKGHKESWWRGWAGRSADRKPDRHSTRPARQTVSTQTTSASHGQTKKNQRKARRK